jgi:NADPH:quinone reductase-like Zn-dependent oxidoreductase
MEACVADGGTVCTYGALAGEEMAIGYPDIIFRGVNVAGFIVGRFLARCTPAEVRALYAEIAAWVREGDLHSPVALPGGGVYPIEEIGAALAHAQRPGKGGKALVAPNGAIRPRLGAGPD